MKCVEEKVVGSKSTMRDVIPYYSCSADWSTQEGTNTIYQIILLFYVAFRNNNRQSFVVGETGMYDVPDLFEGITFETKPKLKIINKSDDTQFKEFQR